MAVTENSFVLQRRGGLKGLLQPSEMLWVPGGGSVSEGLVDPVPANTSMTVRKYRHRRAKPRRKLDSEHSDLGSPCVLGVWTGLGRSEG